MYDNDTKKNHNYICNMHLSKTCSINGENLENVKFLSVNWLVSVGEGCVKSYCCK